MATAVAMADAMAISDGERALGTWSRAASWPPAPAPPTPRARHEPEVVGRSPDPDLLQTAVAAAVDLGAAGRCLRAPSSNAGRTLDRAACPHPRHAAPASGARAVLLPLSAPARRSVPLAAVALARSPAAVR